MPVHVNDLLDNCGISNWAVEDKVYLLCSRHGAQDRLYRWYISLVRILVRECPNRYTALIKRLGASYFTVSNSSIVFIDDFSSMTGASEVGLGL
jgi:hypothetical protein